MAIQVFRDKDGNPKKYQVQLRRGSKSASKSFTNLEAALEHEAVTLKKIGAQKQKAGGATKVARDPKLRSEFAKTASFPTMKVAAIIEEFAKANPEKFFARSAPPLVRRVGAVRVCDLTKAWTKDFCERMRREPTTRGVGLAEGTIANCISGIGRACRWKAQELGIECPLPGLTFEHLDADWNEGRERRLSGDEEERIRLALGRIGIYKKWAKHRIYVDTSPRPCARHYQLIFDFAIETCAREAEMVELPWREIDLDRRTWNLPARRSKTERRRKIFLTEKAVAILRELRADASPTSDLVFHRLPKVKCFSNMWKIVMDRIGIVDLHFHDLKHEGISRHLNEGTFLPGVLMRMVGHSSMKMTMRYFNPQDHEIFARMDALSRGGAAAAQGHAKHGVDAVLAQLRDMLRATASDDAARGRMIGYMDAVLEAKELDPHAAAADTGQPTARRL